MEFLHELRLLIASRLLPEGFRIALPNTEVLPLPAEDETRFVVIVQGKYMRHGHAYYCREHRHSWDVETGIEGPVCPRCRDDAFEHVRRQLSARPMVGQSHTVNTKDWLRKRFEKVREEER